MSSRFVTRARALSWIAAAIALSGAAAPASACDCVNYFPGTPGFERDLDVALSFADVVAEGIIEQPMGPMLEPAIFRPTRVFKGPVRETYRIGVGSNCSLLLRAPEVPVGTPVRLILHGGPDLYEAQRCVNFLGPDFDAAVARRLGQGCSR